MTVTESPNTEACTRLIERNDGSRWRPGLGRYALAALHIHRGRLQPCAMAQIMFDESQFQSPPRIGSAWLVLQFSTGSGTHEGMHRSVQQLVREGKIPPERRDLFAESQRTRRTTPRTRKHDSTFEQVYKPAAVASENSLELLLPASSGAGRVPTRTSRCPASSPTTVKQHWDQTSGMGREVVFPKKNGHEVKGVSVVRPFKDLRR